MTYPTQIPLTFTTNSHSTHYLDLTISLNHHTIIYHKIHHHINQKPHHKYMYPHFSSNHPQHIFTGIIKTETIRYSRLSKTIDDYNFIHKLFTLRLTALDYPNKLITDNSFNFHGYPTTLTNKDLLTVYNKTTTNQRFSTAASTTNMDELTKLYATSSTNTTTYTFPNSPKPTATPQSSTPCY